MRRHTLRCIMSWVISWADAWGAISYR